MHGVVTKGASRVARVESARVPAGRVRQQGVSHGQRRRPGEAHPSPCIVPTPLFQFGLHCRRNGEKTNPSLSPSGKSPASVSEDLREEAGEANHSPRPCAWSASRDWPCLLGRLTPTGCLFLIRPGSLRLPVSHCRHSTSEHRETAACALGAGHTLPAPRAADPCSPLRVHPASAQ